MIDTTFALALALLASFLVACQVMLECQRVATARAGTFWAQSLARVVTPFFFLYRGTVPRNPNERTKIQNRKSPSQIRPRAHIFEVIEFPGCAMPRSRHFPRRPKTYDMAVLHSLMVLHGYIQRAKATNMGLRGAYEGAPKFDVFSHLTF
jgi:hypothetical protein